MTAVDDLRGELDRAVPGAFAPPESTTVDLYGEWRPTKRCPGKCGVPPNE